MKPTIKISEAQVKRAVEDWLQLITDSRYHLIDSVVKQYIKRLENRIRELEANVVRS